MSKLLAFVLALVCLVQPVLADVVVPNSAQSAPGGGTFLGPFSNAQRTYQLLIDDSQLTSVVGQQLNGVTWRLLPSATANWPAADANFADYDIFLSGSVEPSARSNTFASNVVGTQTQVRDGPLTIPAGSFPAGGSPTAFGMVLAFSTPYTYTGGNLLLELRHTGFSGTSASVDSVLASGGPGNGYGTAFSALWQSSASAVTGTQGNAVVTQFTTVPEPTSCASLIACAALSLLARRRQSRI